MKRIRQTFEQIVESLLPVEATWMDDHAEDVIKLLKTIPDNAVPTNQFIQDLLDSDFNTTITAIRLFLDISKDEFTIQFKEKFSGPGGIGITRYSKDKAFYVEALSRMGLKAKMSAAISSPLHWSDILVERLKGGRGSAIKGQQRGRGMEDHVEAILRNVFDANSIAARCRFTGASGLSTEKADFAIPSAVDPMILIEVKAYGATGSKQTDVLGDISRIVEQKRDDTPFFLFTDGITWKERSNDLRKLIELQNLGKIRMIYTKAMSAEFEKELRDLKQNLGL